MDQETKAKWLEALRSGKYAQTTSTLRNENGYCCLGVLCDIVGPRSWSDLTEGLAPPKYLYDGADVLPPGEVLDHAGLSFDIAERLANMNDNGDTFAQIADYIEKHL